MTSRTVKTADLNPFTKGSVSHAAWAVLSTKVGAKLPIPELAKKIEARVKRHVSISHATRLRNRIKRGERCRGVSIPDLPDLRR